MKLNLGCGTRKMPGWTNVDKASACSPDQVVDLEKLPWPWADNLAEEVMLVHVLEHLGATTELFLGIITELYRICRDDAQITIVVPHPRHEFFLGDPTHVRAVSPAALSMFSQAQNREWISKGMANTPLALYLGVDFAIQSVNMMLDEPWRGRFEREEISSDDLNFAARSYNNVIVETQIVMRAIKPPGRSS